ncbi:MAG TPA: hypothetical protein VMU59_06115 [Caulobacteraceae bacterium]|nr:hypothetical protein [Caulobacteraceae bacterium]
MTWRSPTALRLLTRKREGVTPAPPPVVRDELEAGVLVGHCRIPEVTERFYATVQKRRFGNQLLLNLLFSREAQLT